MQNEKKRYLNVVLDNVEAILIQRKRDNPGATYVQLVSEICISEHYLKEKQGV